MSPAVYLVLVGILAGVWGLVERVSRRAAGQNRDTPAHRVNGPLALVVLAVLIYAFLRYGPGTGAMAVLVTLATSTALQLA